MSEPAPPVRRITIVVSDASQPVTTEAPLTAPVAAGAHVRLAADSLRSVMSGFDAGHVVLDDGTPLEAIDFRIPRGQPETGVHRAPRQLLLARCPGGAAPGQTVTVAGVFHPGGATHAASVAPWAGVPITFRLEASEGDPASEDGWLPVTDWFGFLLAAGEPDHLEAFLRSDGSLSAALFDKYLNPTGAPDGLEVLDRGVRVSVSDAAGRRAVSSPRPLTTPEGERLLFGEFHWHSEASGDGCRDLGAAYRSARDGLFLDFAGAADHFPFEPPLSAHPDGLSLGAYAALADSFDAPGRFVTLVGIELSWRMGHYNFYWADRAELDLFVDAWEARHPGPLAGTVYAPDIATFYGLSPRYFDRAHPERTLVVPHHTNVTSENVYTTNGLPVWTHYYWPLGHYDPRFFRLGEIVQTRGCFEAETPDPDWHIRHGAGGGSLRTALAKGFRIGFTGGTDNHSGWPSRQVGGIAANATAGTGGLHRAAGGAAAGVGSTHRAAGGWVGLTAVYAGEFSRAGIMRGLYRRRCYATTGVRIVLDFRLNDSPMGSELRLAPPDERRFAIRVHGTAPLDRVEIVSHDAIVHRVPPDRLDGPDLLTEWRDDRRARPVHDAYYYLRVRQRDGHCAWSSPIWIDLAIPSDGGFSLGGPVAWS